MIEAARDLDVRPRPAAVPRPSQPPAHASADDAVTLEPLLAFIDLWPEPTLLVAADGTLLAANRAAARALGTAPDALRERRLADVVAPPADAALDFLRACAGAGEPVYGALSLPGPHGRPVPFRAEGSALRFPGGPSDLVALRLVPRRRASARFVALSRKVEELTREVAQRRRAELERQDSQRRLEIALQAGRLGAWEWDLATNRVQWSATLATLHGLAPTDAPTAFDGALEVVHPGDRERVRASLRRTATGGPPFHEEYRVQAAGDAPRWVEARGELVRDRDGRPLRLVGVCGDITTRKLAEQELRASEARLRRIIDSNALGLILVNAHGQILEANDAFLHTVGYTRDDVAAGRVRYQDLTPPAYRALDRRALDELLRTGRHAPYEKEYFRKDGRRVPVVVGSASLGPGPSGEPAALGFILDLTEHKHTLDELRRFKFISEHANDAHLFLDAKGHFLYVNRRACELLGRSADDLLRLTLADVNPAFSPDTYQALFARVQLGERVAPFETALLGPGGQSLPAEVSVTGVAFAGQPFLFAVARDISERKQAEAALRASEAQFRTLADSIPQLAWVARPDGTVEWLNRRWFDYTGLAPDTPAPGGWIASLDPRDRDRVTDGWQQALDRREPWEDTFRLLRRDGEPRWHLTRAVPVRDDRGGLTRWFGTHTDITERQQMEQALRDSDRRKDEFLAMLAHELRNPLAPVRNALHLLRLPGGEHSSRLAIDVMERQLTHLIRMVDDLLDVSRITRGKVTLRRQTVALADVLADAVETVRAALAARGHRLDLHLPDPPVLLDADSTRLEQVFANLLSNAVKYTEPGGRIAVAAWRDGGDVVVQVSDTGVGIPAELLPHIFDLFTQAERSLDRSQGGLGIGLALVKALVELHGGTVTAHSPGPGQGSEFTVRLPALPASLEHPAGPVRRLPALAGDSRRVLVVDDNVDAARSLAMLLTAWGHEASLAHDGPAALAEAARLAPDVVLLDIGLPRMDGYEVARRLRATPEGAGLLLIALTGYGQDEDRRRSREAGFDHHLVKPVDTDALRDLLGAAARTPRPAPR